MAKKPPRHCRTPILHGDIFGSETVQNADPAARWIYMALLLRFSERELRPLPNDPDRLAVLAMVTREEFDSAWPQISSQWEAVDGGLVNLRMAGEVGPWIDGASKRSEKARTAALARWSAAECSKHSSEQCLDTCSDPCLIHALPSPSPSPSPTVPSGQRETPASPPSLSARGGPGGGEEREPKQQPKQQQQQTHRKRQTDPGTLGIRKPAPPESYAPEVVEILNALQDVTGVSLDDKSFEENAREVGFLVRYGGLKEREGVPAAGPQSHATILAALRWLKTQPETSGDGKLFSWRPHVDSIRYMRSKWSKLEQASLASKRSNGQSREFAAIDASLAKYERDNP